MTTAELTSFMAGFTGTEGYHGHFLGIKMTDGVKAVADKVGGHWLTDAIASYHRTEPFQVWTLTVDAGRNAENIMASLTMREDTDAPVLVRQDIEFTDFPVGTWKFHLIDGVLLLPSEY